MKSWLIVNLYKCTKCESRICLKGEKKTIERDREESKSTRSNIYICMRISYRMHRNVSGIAVKSKPNRIPSITKHFYLSGTNVIDVECTTSFSDRYAIARTEQFILWLVECTMIEVIKRISVTSPLPLPPTPDRNEKRSPRTVRRAKHNWLDIHIRRKHLL